MSDGSPPHAHLCTAGKEQLPPLPSLPLSPSDPDKDDILFSDSSEDERDDPTYTLENGESDCSSVTEQVSDESVSFSYTPRRNTEITDTQLTFRGREKKAKVTRESVADSDDQEACNKPVQIPIPVESDTDEDDENPDEEEIARDVVNIKIYVKRVLKSETGKFGKKKKSTRVYNSRHECPVCHGLYINWAKHVALHSKYSHIFSMKKGKEKQSAMAVLRRGSDHAHNLHVLEAQRGEIILGRRFMEGEFDVRKFGPCPHCEEWLKLSIIDRHQKKCPASADRSESKGVLLTESAVLAGRISSKASKALTKEVFSVMNHDNIGMLAREDPLIILNGNQWLMRNVGNELNRAYYTSAMMRLSGRLLKCLREVCPKEEGSNWLSNYLKPEHFDEVIQATLMCASTDMDDTDDLQNPSNAIKLGFEIKRLVASKKGLAIRARDRLVKEECSDFMDLMTDEWGVRVTKLAQVTLTERMYNNAKELPEPADLKRLSDFIAKELKTVNLEDKTYDTFRRSAQLVEAKLVSYNRRRTGEIQAMK